LRTNTSANININRTKNPPLVEQGGERKEDSEDEAKEVIYIWRKEEVTLKRTLRWWSFRQEAISAW
jgi:hypothetical protein